MTGFTFNEGVELAKEEQLTIRQSNGKPQPSHSAPLHSLEHQLVCSATNVIHVLVQAGPVQVTGARMRSSWCTACRTGVRRHFASSFMFSWTFASKAPKRKKRTGRGTGLFSVIWTWARKTCSLFGRRVGDGTALQSPACPASDDMTRGL